MVYLRQSVIGIVAAAVFCASIAAQTKSTVKDATMTRHAHGSFDVKVQPLPSPPAEGLQRMSLEKTLHGSLEARSKGEMISGGDFKAGSAGYVAMEVITGTLDGKAGSFALQHMATMSASDANGPKMEIIAVPGSGTGELKGISGTFTIIIDEGRHSYTFDYTLP